MKCAVPPHLVQQIIYKSPVPRIFLFFLFGAVSLLINLVFHWFFCHACFQDGLFTSERLCNNTRE